MLPEVVLLAKAEDPLCRNTNILIPDLPCLVVLQIDRRIQPVRIQSYYLRQKFPGPGNGLLLKIIAKRKVPQHFKECTVACGLSYILNVAGTDTFLAGGHPLAGRDLLSGKIRL